MYSKNMDDTSKKRLVRNEKLIREKNLAASRSIKKYFRNSKEIREAPIAFVCECSQLDCDEHVNISIARYEKLHRQKDLFIVFRGHDTPSVERVVEREGDFDIVEKFSVPAA